MVPETRVFQAANGEDLAILACTIFDLSTRVTNGRMDRQTDRIAMATTRYSSSCDTRYSSATAVAAVVRKNDFL